ncbi:acyl-CoA dehydrogenase [Streptomyces sp. TR02-1]|uniref:acyl-CoA dehydrogenase n=1 Tax=Streptomyces sp. TR02-1 TaxID=3385977 RepID=UPI0039A17F75
MSEFDELLTHPLFAREAPLGGAERHEVTYRRLEMLSRFAGGAAALRKDRARLVEMLAWAGVVDPPVFLAGLVQHAVCYEAMASLGHRSRYLDAVMDEIDRGEAHGSILVTEVGYGNSHLGCGTVARWCPAERLFRLFTPEPGAAKVMANVAGLAGGGRNAVVYARVEDASGLGGVFPFAVRLRHGVDAPEGLRVRAMPETAGMPLDYALVTFDGMPVPVEGWLRDTAALAKNQRMVLDDLDVPGRTVRSLSVSANASAVTAAACAAASRAAVATGLRFSSERMTRGRFGRDVPVLEFSTQRDALYGALARVWAVGAFVDQAVGEFTHPGGRVAEATAGGSSATWAPWASVSRDGALAKAAAADVLGVACAATRERSGALGFAGVNRIGVWESLGQAAQAAAGDTLLVRLDAARQLVEDDTFRVQLEKVPSDDWSQTSTAVHLADVRSQSLLQEVRWRLDMAPEEQRETLETWNPLLPMLVEIADAHTVRKVLRAATEACDGSAGQRALLHLYGLWSVRSHMGWFLEKGVLSRSAAQSMRSAWREAVDAVHSRVPRLVEELDVPPERTGAAGAGPEFVTGVLEASRRVL